MLTYEAINGKHGIFDGILLVAVVGECIQPHVRDEAAREYAERMVNSVNTLAQIFDDLANSDIDTEQFMDRVGRYRAEFTASVEGEA